MAKKQDATILTLPPHSPPSPTPSLFKLGPPLKSIFSIFQMILIKKNVGTKFYFIFYLLKILLKQIKNFTQFFLVQNFILFITNFTYQNFTKIFVCSESSETSKKIILGGGPGLKGGGQGRGAVCH